jgi:MSHA pilin protein MshD
MCTTRRAATGTQAGFTLIELIFFIVVVSVGIVGILRVMDVSVTHSADPLIRKQTVAIAESLLEEILLKSYNDPDGVAVVEATRALYDDVSDYAGYTTSGGMVDIGGNPIAGLALYNVSNVVVVNVTLNGLNARKVTVTVTGPGGALDLTGYRTDN